MRATSIVMALLLVFAFCRFASAEFYRYVDKHGNVIYTDDINQIPADQRDKAASYEESYGNEEPAVPEKAEDMSDKKAVPDAMEAERQKLLEQKKTLDKEFEDLKKQRTELDEAKTKAVTSEQRKTYNQQIIEFNTRAKAHQEKVDAHTAQVNSYNERLEKSEMPEKQEEE